MGTEQIRVDKQDKNQLEEMKREGESFADVVSRLLENQGQTTWHDAVGDLTGEEADSIREQLEETREKQKDRQERLSGL